MKRLSDFWLNNPKPDPQTGAQGIDSQQTQILLIEPRQEYGVIHARTTIAGADYHVTLILVHDVPDGDGIRQEAVDDPDGHFNARGEYDGRDGPYETFRLPDGTEWVLVMVPYCR